MPMPAKCKCGRFVSATEGAKCKRCASIFHRECINLSPSDVISSKWVCDPCHKIKSKATGSKTPSNLNSTVISNSQPIATVSAGITSLQDDPANCIVTELRLLRSEMASFRGEIAQLNATLSEFNNRLDSIDARVLRLEEQSSSKESSENHNSMQATILQLQSQINDRDQDLLMNDVVISGLQEVSGENTMSLTSLIAKKLGVDLDDRDIVSAERAGARRTSSASNENGVRPPQSRPVVVRLARRAVRDRLLQAARVRRNIDTAGIIDAEPPRRFYINEHLTRFNKKIFYKAREQGRNNNYKFIWTKGCRIFLRQTSTAPIHRVRSESDIKRLFSVNESF